MSSGRTTEARYREFRQIPKLPLFKSGDKIGVIKTYSGGTVSQTLNRICVGSEPHRFIDRCWDHTNPPRKGKNGHLTFSTGKGLAIIHVKALGTTWSPEVTVNNVGKPGITAGNRTEYRGRFGISLFDEIDRPHYGTAGGLNIDLNPFVTPITPDEESAAWNIRPKLERASVATALYELREMPALLKQTSIALRESWGAMTGNFGGQRMWPNKAASDFLAVEFGWKPFVGDVLKMLDTLVSMRNYIEQLIAQNNTWIKRRRILGETENTTHKLTLTGNGLQPTFGDIGLSTLCRVDPITGSVGDRTLERVIKTRTWAVGSFKFYRPELDRMREDFFSLCMQARRQILVYGARINPSHIWQIIPWSWLIDWFTNFGDIIARADEAYNDGMVARYLYVMKQTDLNIVQTHSYNFWSGTLTFKAERSVVSKLRRHADSPYGFVLAGGLSARQFAILGALGLTRNASTARTL